MWKLIGKTPLWGSSSRLPSEMQSPLLLLLSSTKATKVAKVSSSTKVTFILFLFSTTTRVTLTDDPGIPSVKYNLQLGDLTVKTELSTNNNNNSGQTVRT